MAQYDVFETTIPGLRKAFPYIVVLQSDLIEGGRNRIVAPLIPLRLAPDLAGRLGPILRLDADGAAGEYVLAMLALTNMPAADLKRRTASVAACRDVITRALDLVFQGF